MPALKDTLDQLVSTFAEDIIAAIRDVPLDELVGSTSNVGLPRAPRPARSAPPRKSTLKKPAAVEVSSGPPASIVVDEVERFFDQRGQKGATASQVDEHLRAGGFPHVDGASQEVIGLLVERGAIRDAGFRRTTGSGTAPVYVANRDGVRREVPTA
jgi:hypothetical protein